jgi:hypothetical protein
VAGTNIAVTSETFNKASDKSWIRVRDGLDRMLPITLDISSFNAEHVANGYLPSGIALGKITASGKYGPYSPALSNGLETMVGHLFEEVKVTALTDADCGAALFWNGVVVESKLPAFTGTGDGLGEVDAAGKVDTASWIKYV